MSAFWRYVSTAWQRRGNTDIPGPTPSSGLGFSALGTSSLGG